MIQRFDSERGPVVVVQTLPGESIDELPVPAPPFVCAVVLTDETWPRAWLDEAIRHLIASGAAYFCFYGSRCEEAHDIADRVRCEEPLDPAGDDVVMTTWHDDESLSEYFWFVAHCAQPAEGYGANLGGYLVAMFGPGDSANLAATAREMFP